MRNILTFLLFLMLTSCMTVERIQKNCDKFAQVCITDTETIIEYRDTTIIRTDTIQVALPKDTVRLVDTVKIYNNLAYLPMTQRRFGIIGVDAGVERSVLNVSAYLTDSTILHPMIDTITLERVIREKATTNNITLPPEKYIPRLYKFSFRLVILQIMLLAVWLAYRFNLGSFIKSLFRKVL